MSAGVAVADAWAILALLRGEGQAALAMKRCLRRARTGNRNLLLNLVNLGEVYYRFAQIRNTDEADEAVAMLKQMPIDFYPIRERLVLEAARVKADYPLSYADAFAVATGRLESAPVLTGDPEILDLPRDVVAVRRLDRSDSKSPK